MKLDPRTKYPRELGYQFVILEKSYQGAYELSIFAIVYFQFHEF